MKNEDLVGVWRERGRENVDKDGTVTPDIARTSQIMYTADGYMGVVNTPAGRARVNESVARMDLDAASAAERAQAAIGVVAYAGTLRLKVKRCFTPSSLGQSQPRRRHAAPPHHAQWRRPDANRAAGCVRKFLPHPLAAGGKM